jgi:hypothetical protein
MENLWSKFSWCQETLKEDIHQIKEISLLKVTYPLIELEYNREIYGYFERRL